MDSRPIASGYAHANHACPQNQTDSIAPGLSNSVQKATERFSFFCNDVRRRFDQRGGPALSLVVPDHVASQYENQDVAINQVGVLGEDLREIFSEVANRQERVYSASELTQFIYQKIDIPRYVSPAIYGFFQDRLEETLFYHPAWIKEKANGRIGISSQNLMEWINDLIASKGVVESDGGRYVNLFSLHPSHDLPVQFTCVKLERGVLKYSSSLESLVKKLLEFQPSRALINSALKDRKITIIAAKPSSPVGYKSEHDHRALFVNELKPFESQLGYTLRGISELLASDAQERMQEQFANGQIEENAFVHKMRNADRVSLKLCNHVIDQGVRQGLWSETANILTQREKQAVVSEEAYQQYYAAIAREAELRRGGRN